MTEITTVMKLDNEEQIAYGWATRPTEGGDLVVDRQNEVFKSGEMEKMATNFMLKYRVGKEMHKGKKVAEVVHSMPLTEEIQKAFGMNLGFEGWAIGMKVYDERVWEMFKSGKYKAFSIGGRAKRRPYVKE